MLAFLAAVAFALALVLHLIGHGAGSLVTDFVLGGLLCLSLDLAFRWPVPFGRRG